MPSVRLDWTPPTTFADGLPLNPATDLQGYRLEYFFGNVSNNQTPIEIPGGETMTFQLDNLPNDVIGFRIGGVMADGTLGNRTQWVQVDESKQPANAPGGFTVTVL